MLQIPKLPIALESDLPATTETTVRDSTDADEVSLLAEPAVPKGNVLGCVPFLTDDRVAGSKKMSGSFAGSCACTSPISSAFRGVSWQKTEFRFVGGSVVKS